MESYQGHGINYTVVSRHYNVSCPIGQKLREKGVGRASGFLICAQRGGGRWIGVQLTSVDKKKLKRFTPQLKLEILRKNCFEMINQEPREWRNSRYAFLNPKFMNGVLVEITDGD